MALSLFDFQPFLEHEPNQSIIDSGKFGIYELIDGKFIETEITQNEFIEFTFVDMADFEITDEIRNNYITGRPFLVRRY